LLTRVFHGTFGLGGHRPMLSGIVARLENSLGASTSEEMSAGFFSAMEDFGATYLQTRLYRRPLAPLSPASHWAAGGFVTRIAREGWVGSAAHNYICFDCNPLLNAIRENRTRYRFSDFAPRGRREYGAYWDAFSDGGIADGLCATSYGPEGAIASLHLGISDAAIPVEESRAIQMAGLILTEKLLDFADFSPAPVVRLTARERDALAFVADGKTDWEISVILGISEATARFHVDNARAKLGAVNRAQAVAKLVHQRLI
jgi:LuxR family quorum sensing-dependent transcriptional regulator